MFNWLKQRLVDIVSWFSDIFVSIFHSLWDIIKDAVCWILDQFLGLASGVLNLIDVSGLSGFSNSWGSLPSEILTVMGLLGFGPAALIIVSACTIRLILQTVPFVRWGS